MIGKKKFLNVFILIVVVFSLSACKPKTTDKTVAPSKTTQTEQTLKVVENYQASFAVFTDGIFRVFTAAMYHDKSDDAFITSANPNLIQINNGPITWGEFFNSMPLELKNDCLWTGTLDLLCTNETKTLKFYVNGTQVTDFVNTNIQPEDQALITYGAESDSQIQQQLSEIPKL